MEFYPVEIKLKAVLFLTMGSIVQKIQKSMLTDPGRALYMSAIDGVVLVYGEKRRFWFSSFDPKVARPRSGGDDFVSVGAIGGGSIRSLTFE